MELPHIRPLKIFPSSELDYFDLLGKITNNRHDGFLRISKGPKEGYVLFKEGMRIAASYTEYLGKRSNRDIVNKEYFKEDAIKQIERNMISEKGYITEVFELNSSQIDYAIELNTKYLIELKNQEKKTESLEENSKSISTSNTQERIIIKTETPTSLKDSVTVETVQVVEIPQVVEDEPVVDAVQVVEIPQVVEDEPVVDAVHVVEIPQVVGDEPVAEIPQVDEVPSVVEDEPVAEAPSVSKTITPKPKKKSTDQRIDNNFKEILGSKSSLELSDEDIDELEITIMDKIKNTLLNLPEVSSAEGSMMIDNGEKIGGNIYLIIEYKSKGFLNWIVGSSRETTDLKIEITKLAQNEIKNSFIEFNKERFQDAELDFDFKIDLNRK